MDRGPFRGYCTVVLAAGKGTRLKAELSKMLVMLDGQVLVAHVVRTALSLGGDEVVVVVGHQADAVKGALTAAFPGAPMRFALQRQQRGTGDALAAGLGTIPGRKGSVVVLSGDVPLIRRSTLLRLLRTRESRDVDLALLSMELAEPGHYGRIVREGGRVVRVVEYLDADEQTRRISEVNAGVYCIDIEFLRETLRSVGTVNVKGELYLTDLVAAASDRRGAIAIQVTPDEVRGVNTWTEQAELERIVRRREIARLMRNGVQVDEPETLIVESSVRVSTGCRLGPGVTLRAGTVIGRNCRIEQGSILDGCKLGQGAWIRPYCVLDGVKVPHGADIAPYTYLVGEERGYHSEINQSRRHETGRRTRQQHQMAAGSPSRERKK